MMPILKSTRRHQPAGQNARGSAAPTSLVGWRQGAVGALSSMAASRSTPPSRASGHDWSGTDLDLAAELAAARAAFDQELRAKLRGEEPLVYLCVCLDEIGKLRRRHRRHLGAFAREPFADIRIFENLVDVPIEPGDDVGRRA